MRLKGKCVKAMIFDLDGTLFDSTQIWEDVDHNFFQKRKIEEPSWYGKKVNTMGIDQAAVFTKEYFHLPESPKEMIQEWLDDVIKEYTCFVPLKPHAKELLEIAKKEGVSLSVATANSKECYEPALIRLDIKQEFDHIVDVKDFKNGKNDPELYLFVANKVGLKPEEILIFEDSPKAAAVAKEAGFGLVCVFDKTWSKEDELEKKRLADLYIDDFQRVIDALED